MLGVSPATIRRELKRNKGQKDYTVQNRHKSKRISTKTSHKSAENEAGLDAARIVMDWSPEQVSGQLKAESGIQISHEHIYQYIWADKRHDGTLYMHLRQNSKKRKS